jgi:transglutaminase-like putative cysteine protease
MAEPLAGRTQAGIPRIALIWLLTAQALVIVPHLTHLPLWVAGLWLLCAGWRIQVFRMRARFPGSALKVLLMAGAVGGVLLSRGQLFGLEAGTALLVAAFVLKLLEMKTRRDALVVIFLGFFTVVTAYLFDDGMLLAAFSLLPVTALVAALIGLQQSALAERPWPTLRLAAGLLLQALPLMLLLFVFFPRLGPLWSLPTPQNKAVTGLSDSIAPGDIARLSQSGELAFRASFDGPPPPRSRLYWRALTLDRFDGQRWTQSGGAQYMADPRWVREGEPLRYSVVMQPSGRPWLFALDVGETDAERTRLMSDFRLERFRPVDSPLLYRVTSWPAARRDPELPAETRRRELQLPSQGNPRSRAWAAELQRRYPAPEALVGALLRHFHDQPYRYTLRPAPVGQDIVDGFLFDSRDGFCIHYAGALTFVLRAAGVPARIVAGYQGGELNPAGNYLSVHQFDAHAWVEYWQAGRGWVSVDPTFQVAPERIENGLEAAVASEQSFLEDSPFSPLRYRDIGWLNQLRLAWDRLNYGWERWVLGYQADQQLQVLQRWFGSVDWSLLGLGLVAATALLVGLVTLWLFKPWRRERDPQLRQFRRFERLLARQGLRRSPGEGARAFAGRCAIALPGQASIIREFADRFEAARYAGRPVPAEELSRSLRSLARRLPRRPLEAR